MENTNSNINVNTQIIDQQQTAQHISDAFQQDSRRYCSPLKEEDQCL